MGTDDKTSANGPDADADADADAAPQTPCDQRPDSKLYVGQATTAVTAVDIQTLSFPDGSRGTFQTPGPRSDSTPPTTMGSSSGRASSPGYNKARRSPSGGGGGEADDEGASVASLSPTTTTMRPAGDIASLFVGDLNKRSLAWSVLRSQAPMVQPFERSRYRPGDRLSTFAGEFASVPAKATDGLDDGARVSMWKAKLKHFLILSSAGKPIWSRHGDLTLINSFIGVMQTIISFYESSNNSLLGFTAGDARFVVLTRNPLHFVAISKLGESDSQLRAQLDALYMQILSTLTLPTLQRIFVHRPSSDLRKPLQGTESLLSSLADTFTRGSASTLLGSLECLKLRKSQRNSINNTFLKVRSDKLLYGLIVAGGKLVSVIRPRRHSLHPSDLRLVFNMLFDSEGIKGGGGENWIPLCLPAFNNAGYLYMYVSFFDQEKEATRQQSEPAAAAESSEQVAFDQEIAIVLISTDKESFFSLKQMRDNVAQQLVKNGGLAVIRSAVRAGRPRIAQVVLGGNNPMKHFLYKSKANVQFCMASLEAPLDLLSERRRLMNVYHEMHAAVHAKQTHLKILHNVSEDSTSLAWVTPVFELYCVGGPNMSRATMGQGANKIIQWAKKEEQRLFIIGGGVF